MAKRPNVTVKLIFRYKDKTLILKHPDGVISFPGGRMEWGESILEALNRELKEEINYSLKEEPALLDLWNYVSENGERHSVFINFIYQVDKKPELYSPEGLELLWLTKKEIIERELIKGKEFVDKIFKWKPAKNN